MGKYLKFFIGDGDVLCVDCCGIVADLETNMGYEEMKKLRELGIDPMIIFDKLLEGVETSITFENDEEKASIIKNFESIISKLLMFFGNNLKTLLECVPHNNIEDNTENDNPDFVDDINTY